MEITRGLKLLLLAALCRGKMISLRQSGDNLSRDITVLNRETFSRTLSVFEDGTKEEKEKKKVGIGSRIKGREGDAINSIPIFVIANLMGEIPRCVSSFRFIENRYRCMLSREQFSPLFCIVYQHRLSVKVLLCRLVVRVPLAPWLRSSGKSQYRDRSRGFFSRGISIFFLPRVRCLSS